MKPTRLSNVYSYQLGFSYFSSWFLSLKNCSFHLPSSSVGSWRYGVWRLRQQMQVVLGTHILFRTDICETDSIWCIDGTSFMCFCLHVLHRETWLSFGRLRRLQIRHTSELLPQYLFQLCWRSANFSELAGHTLRYSYDPRAVERDHWYVDTGASIFE